MCLVDTQKNVLRLDVCVDDVAFGVKVVQALQRLQVVVDYDFKFYENFVDHVFKIYSYWTL